MRLKKVHIKFSKLSIIKGTPFIKNRGTFIIKDGVKINSKYSVNPIGGSMFCTFVIAKDAELMILEGSRLSNITINCSKKIHIGKNVFLGGDSRIYDSDFHSLDLPKRLEKVDKNIKKMPIIINDGVFIGASVLILKGVEIGQNSVIGAGSVVSKSIPANEIWAGNPAKFIRSLNND